MGRHRRFGGHRWGHGGHGGRGKYGFSGQSSDHTNRGTVPPGRPKPIVWVLALAGVGIWSLLAWAAYGVAEPFFGWAAANAGPFGSGLGVGGIGNLLGRLSAGLQSVAQPAILIVWAIGALGLLTVPMILPAILRMRGRYHY